MLKIPKLKISKLKFPKLKIPNLKPGKKESGSESKSESESEREIESESESKSESTSESKAKDSKAKDPKAKIIIMGDLNDDPVSPSVKKVMGAKGKKQQVKAGEFFNPAWDLYKQGLGTLAWSDSWNLFDQMLVSHGTLNDNKGYKFYMYDRFYRSFLINQAGRFKGYPFRTYAGGKYQGGYSDHLPVYLYLVKKK